MVLFGEPTRKDGGRARCAQERMAGRGLAGVRGMGEVWRGMACTTAADGMGAGRGGAVVHVGEGFAGESPLCMATNLVTTVRGDSP